MNSKTVRSGLKATLKNGMIICKKKKKLKFFKNMLTIVQAI